MTISPTPEPLTVREHKLDISALSLSVDKDELRRLLELLQERSMDAADIALAHVAPESKAAAKTIIAEDHTLFVTLSGSDGVQLNGTIAQIFDSPKFPTDVATVFVDSGTKARNRNFGVRNSLLLFFDLRRPAVFDFGFMPSQATANPSNFVARGIDGTWVHGVFHEVESFVREHSASGKWIHRHTVFDVLQWVIGFPLAFWVCFRLSPLVGKISEPFGRAAVYTYAFVFTLFAFRALFHYARWSWPLVEYRQPNSRAIAHRAFWAVGAGSGFFAFLWDTAKHIVGWN